MYYKGAFESMTGLRVNYVSKIVNAYIDSPSISPALNCQACPDSLNQIRIMAGVRITITNNVIDRLNDSSRRRTVRRGFSWQRKIEIRNLRRNGESCQSSVTTSHIGRGEFVLLTMP